MTETPIEAVRITKLFGDILTQRLACNLSGDGDEALFRRHYGPQGSFVFWGNFLQGIVTFPMFVQRLAHARAENWARIDVTKMALQAALIEAYQSDEAFFRGDLTELKSILYARDIQNPNRIKLLGRGAAEWLSSSSKWGHLVAPTLRAFLRGDRPVADTSASSELPKARRGPKSDLTERTASAMLEDLSSGRATIQGLKNEKQEALAARYNVRSRDTAVKALDRAVLRFASGRNSDK